MPEKRRRATEAEAAALASGIRLRIIRLTFAEALTNRELAERLGRDPATTLHHVRTLVDTGFLVAEAARRGARGSREIPYRATKLSWALDFGDCDSIRMQRYSGIVSSDGSSTVAATSARKAAVTRCSR